MILDGYWKKDLKKFIRQLRFWSCHRFDLVQGFAEHKINQALLYSAAIVRKIVEDDEECDIVVKQYNWQRPPLEILDYKVPVRFYKHVDEEKYFAVSKLFLDDYDTKNSIEMTYPIKRICNQFIHSYVWGMVHCATTANIYGAMFASDRDKEKGVYLLKIDDWINTLQFIIDHCSI